MPRHAPNVSDFFFLNERKKLHLLGFLVPSYMQWIEQWLGGQANPVYNSGSVIRRAQGAAWADFLKPLSFRLLVDKT